MELNELARENLSEQNAIDENAKFIRNNNETTENLNQNAVVVKYEFEAAPGDDGLQNGKKLKYPKSVFFIVSNEFCERFSYYGMRTILSIYLTDMLLFSESTAKVIYHAFTMLVYFFPVFGAMLADSYLGKFRTIFYVSIIYACGNVLLALSATEPIGLPIVPFSLLGLLLIAIGTGGIKPCVAAFGGDQFILPQQAKQLVAYFSMFYFSINSGSLVSTFLTPILREQACFGNDECFTLAFGVPGVLMIVSIIIFGLGKPLYRIKEPEGNMVIQVSKCIGNAVSTKKKSSEKKDHWLDFAVPKYSQSFVDDIKATLRVLVLYLPLPVFWALFDQQGTGWTFMARRMDGDIGFYTILPDQVQVVNPILILLYIPLFDMVVYPLFARCNFLKTPLQRLVVGGLLAAASFIISAGVYIAIEAENPVLPEAGQGQVTFYNFNDNDLVLKNLKHPSVTYNVPKLGYILLEEEVTGKQEIPYSVDGLPGLEEIKFHFEEEQTVGNFLKEGELTWFEDSLEKSSQGLPAVRTMINSNQEYAVTYILDDNEQKLEKILEPLDLKHPGEYKIKIGSFIPSKKFEFKLGGVYTVLVNPHSDTEMEVEAVTITEPNGVHMLWILPQYIVITAGEIMFSVTGLEFSYSQAPTSMKSVMQAAWLLTTAFGNLIVVIIEAVEPFELQSNNFFLYAGLMVVDMFIFALMAMRYKYVTPPGEEKDEKLGIENEAYSSSNEKKLDD